MTTAGVERRYTDRRNSGSITAGADGALWFTAIHYGSGGVPDGWISRITTAGKITTYSGTGIKSPIGIVSGQDGAVWFTNNTGNSVGRIAPPS
jgi:virginiamycin B lyase